jgi:hypothetical protein
MATLSKARAAKTAVEAAVNAEAASKRFKATYPAATALGEAFGPKDPGPEMGGWKEWEDCCVAVGTALSDPGALEILTELKKQRVSTATVLQLLHWMDQLAEKVGKGRAKVGPVSGAMVALRHKMLAKGRGLEIVSALLNQSLAGLHLNESLFAGSTKMLEELKAAEARLKALQARLDEKLSESLPATHGSTEERKTETPKPEAKVVTPELSAKAMKSRLDDLERAEMARKEKRAAAKQKKKERAGPKGAGANSASKGQVPSPEPQKSS